MVKISIIIPIYNVEKYLRRCLDSIVNQTLKDIECLLINDGSPDQSQKIIDEYVSQYPYLFKSYIKENGGQGDARNFGLNYANGEYIAFIDSDDWIESTMFEKMYQAAIVQSADLVICDFLIEWGELKESEYICGLSNNSTDSIKNALLSPPAPWNKIYKKELFLNTDICYPKGLWYEDLATTARLLLHCHKVAHINEALVHYVQREGSTMSTINKKMLDIYTALELVENYFKLKGVYTKYKTEIEYLYIENLVLYGNKRFLKLKSGDKYIKESIQYMNNKFPQWLKNPYIDMLSRGDKLILNLLKRNQLLLLKSLIFIKQKIINKLD